VDGLDRLLGFFGGSAAALHLELVLPLGLSFYTFQKMSYCIDVYRRQMQPVTSLVEFALFACFFPQLVSGPIERAPHLVPQIQRARRLTRAHVDEGLVLLVWGLFKKVALADNLARVVDPVYTPGAQPAGLDVVLATVAFTFLAYADFSGYTDIARGTARLLGFELVRNFDVPFGARDMGEFWRRWHISLGTWLRDYLYIPLGGNRRGGARLSFNLWLTLFLAGLWHGSSATFVAFGAYHGSLVVLSRWYRRWRPLRPGRSHWPAMLVTFGLFTAGMVFFRAQSYAQCEALIAAVLAGVSWQPEAWSALLLMAVCAAPLVVADVFQWRAGSDLYVLSWPLAARAATYLGIFYAIVLFGRSDGYSFLYFQF
jgi:D-alanyl-lipoteichoic acid acyltransferase DltB (MBOAT superfamily)